MTTETDYPPLTEAEVQAEKVRHWNSRGLCDLDEVPFPCPTIRLIAERERQLYRLIIRDPASGDRRCLLCLRYGDPDDRLPFPHDELCALAETGESDES